MSDLGGLVTVTRNRVPWRRVVVMSVVMLPLVGVVTKSAVAVGLTALGLAAVVLLSRRIRLEVHDEGVVVGGFVTARRYHLSEITAFSPMPLSTGRPGFSGAVVVDGVNHEILALSEPGLYERLRDLNERLLLYRAEVGADECVPPTPTDRRADWSRRRMTLWLGPGAAWWPRSPSGEPPPSGRG